MLKNALTAHVLIPGSANLTDVSVAKAASINPVIRSLSTTMGTLLEKFRRDSATYIPEGEDLSSAASHVIKSYCLSNHGQMTAEQEANILHRCQHNVHDIDDFDTVIQAIVVLHNYTNTAFGEQLHHFPDKMGITSMLAKLITSHEYLTTLLNKQDHTLSTIVGNILLDSNENNTTLETWEQSYREQPRATHLFGLYVCFYSSHFCPKRGDGAGEGEWSATSE